MIGIALISSYTSAEYTIVFDNYGAGVGGANVMQTTKFVVMVLIIMEIYILLSKVVYIQTHQIHALKYHKLLEVMHD